MDLGRELLFSNALADHLLCASVSVRNQKPAALHCVGVHLFRLRAMTREGKLIEAAAKIKAIYAGIIEEAAWK